MKTKTNYLSIAKKAASQSGRLFKQYFGHPTNIRHKGNDIMNNVTEIDLKIEQAIRKIIKKEFPNHKIIGEEYGQQKIELNDFYWAIDPIDGTNNYIRGLPLCCISLALWQHNTPLVAVLFNPITNEMFSAEKGRGAFLNNTKISVTQTSDFKKTYGAVGWRQERQKAVKMFSKMTENFGKIRFLGSSALQMCYVACGIFDFYITSDIKFWDFAAASLIVQEAGGLCSEFSGKTINKNSEEIICSNKALHKKLVIEFKKV